MTQLNSMLKEEGDIFLSANLVYKYSAGQEEACQCSSSGLKENYHTKTKKGIMILFLKCLHKY